MKKEIVIALCSTLLVLGGCSRKNEKAQTSATSKPKSSAKASESAEPSESAEATKSTEPFKTPEATVQTPASTPKPAQQSTAASGEGDPTGTYQIISYDNGSGNRQTFEPGKDTSIMGSSSIVLNQDGSCQFNLPGMSSDGCTWSGTQINTNGTQIDYSVNGDEMTVNNAGGTYVFKKAE